MLYFVFFAYTLGPLVTISYGLNVLSLSPLEVFTYLSLLNILPLPLLFWFFDFGRSREIYRMRIIRRISKLTSFRFEEVVSEGDRITTMFEERLGHIGFYFSISLFTFVFGVFWAAVLSYFLAVNRKIATLCISAGVIVGNVFWLMMIEFFREYLTYSSIMFIGLFMLFLAYGSRQEMKVLKEIASKLSARLR